ncbi:class IV adenylate cyclase [uncultured Microscilla sp.]|uniref:class IV adenylate cyclase n=1 Tax=uncultured Microscilla sp. TaxID=432653 RepID=UPI00260D1CA2|nr:class IV adenylate cyclase [uncultured Microscilla sp.]
MQHLLVEIKARTAKADQIRTFLEKNKTYFKGVDYQTDTYFKVNKGRLKLREGNIENHLIQYYRPNQAEAKTSEVLLYKSNPESTLKQILTNALGELVVVKKKREIYFIDNVKFHIDEVDQLGSFAEIEAIGNKGEHLEEDLRAQCLHYQQLLGIRTEDLVEVSYSDMLLANE